MCINRQSEDMEEEAAIDEGLLALWSKWKLYVSLYLSDKDMANVDWIESFCSDMRENLKRLKDKGKLPADAGSSASAEASSPHDYPRGVWKVLVLPEQLRPSPRRLPTVGLDGTQYIVDERLGEFRACGRIDLRVAFDSKRGLRMLRRFYVDICAVCRQEVAVRLDTSDSHIVCLTCGNPVEVNRSLCRPR
jgi:hypothetical protein